MANAGAAGGDPNGSTAATAEGGGAKEKSGKGKDKYKPGGRKKK